MASGATRLVTGSVMSTGASLDVSKVGFKPLRVHLRVSTNEGWWTQDMADDTVWKRVTAGTASEVSSGGVTPIADGFTLGTDTDLNPASPAVIYYECEG